MKNMGKYILRGINLCILFLSANAIVLGKEEGSPFFWLFVFMAFLFLNIKPAFYTNQLKTARLRACQNGCELLILFLASTFLSFLFLIAGMIWQPGPFGKFLGWWDWLFYILLAVAVESIVFWNGIIRIYVTSSQLGMKWRVIGIVCGWIPVVHLVVLCRLIGIASKEAAFENKKLVFDEKRSEERICATKYPILMVHGVFFRDYRYLNYWGRIPKALEKNGAVIYYGNHQSAASVAESGKELAERIRNIVRESGCGKVNIIAHSKGGLDCRYALANLGVGDLTASLTTVNTPHRGCEFADYLLSKIPEKQKQGIAHAYNATLRKLGDLKPDFLAAVNDLTAESCRKFNQVTEDVEGVFYQSIGTGMRMAGGGRFPLNFTYRLVKYFDGENDGLVGAASFPWGQRYEYLKAGRKRGISHGDMIDLNRENLPEFDVREFYVQLVRDLKERGF